MTFETAQAAIRDAFLAAFTSLDADTQVVFGPEPFDPPSETTWARLEVMETGRSHNTHGSSSVRDWRSDGVAMCTFYLVEDAADSAMNTLTQLYRNTFEGEDIGSGIHFAPGCLVSGKGQDGRWVTKTCRAPFFFYEQR